MTGLWRSSLLVVAAAAIVGMAGAREVPASAQQLAAPAPPFKIEYRNVMYRKL